MSLALFKSELRELTLLQTSWKASLDKVITNAVVNGLLLKGVVLINGVTVINHRLGRKEQGFFITDINAAATVYRSQPFNALTLTLTSSAAVTVDLYVF